MCELFAMRSRFPATVSISLSRLAEHGGLTGPHRDGWGVAYREERDVRLFKGPEPASDSLWVRFIREQGLESSSVISHIRRATLGRKSYSNSQPFIRELGARTHMFAHNGHLPGIEHDRRFGTGFHLPVGETDSELAFCNLLSRLQAGWLCREAPALNQRIEIIGEFARDLRRLGPANFLYCDGDYIYAHGHRRHQDSGRIEAPGLHMLDRHCDVPAGFRGAGVALDSGEQSVTLFASVPLSDERWRPLDEGMLVVAGPDGIESILTA